jgi:DNA polymerase elongation subunit (family B)
MTNKIKYNKDRVIYCDTDSLFVSAQPFISLMEKRLNRELTYDEKVKFTYELSKRVQDKINENFSEFAKQAFQTPNHCLEIKQEYVSETAIWIAKKRYAQKIISEKGVSIKDMTGGKKEFKLDVKGLDVVRSSFPKAFRGFMSGIILDILNKANKQEIVDKIFNLKTCMPDIEIYDVMTISGIKELSKYQCKNTNSIFKTRPKGMPIHAKSAANYNDLLEHFKITYLAPISDGDKIKWTYLKSNRLGIETLALTGFNDPPEIYSIFKENIDYDRIFESSLENKLNDFFKALGWSEVPKNNNGNKFFDFG